jgi:hypothetical protein
LALSEKDDEGNVIVTYPRTEIKMDEYNFYIRFHLLPGQTTRQWENRIDAFGHALSAIVVSAKIDRGTVDLTLQHTQMNVTEPLRKTDDEHYLWIGYKPGGLLKWEFDVVPNMLVVGVVGAGKSTFLRTILSQIPHDWILRIVDGKQVEFTYMRDLGYDVVQTKEQFLRYIDEAVQEMDRRYDEMVREGKNHYAETDFKPYFLFVDEWITLVESLEKKSKERGEVSERDKFFEKLKTLTTKGRAAGVSLVGILQRPDAEFLSGIVRDMFTCKVVLKGSKAAFKMAFDDDGKELQPLGRGQGYCMMEEISSFSFPNYSQDQFISDLKAKRAAAISSGVEAVEGEPEPIGG